MQKNIFSLYTIIFLEGYVVLSTELLAIRQLIPFVGSGTETVAIIIAAVLMPLAFGYYLGGKYKTKQGRKGLITIREKLIRNILNSSIILLFGLSYIFLELFFSTLDKVSLNHRIIQTSIYSLLFLVIPIFLLGQTVPLVSNYFTKQKLSAFAGKVLFASTVGSFMGAILSTLVLMSFIGVNNTVIVNMVILTIVVFILSKQHFCFNNIFMIIITIAAIGLNNNPTLKKMNIVENNRYSTISIGKDNFGDNVLYINRSGSAKYTSIENQQFPYVRFIETNFIKTMPKNSIKKILIVGAGGFTMGFDDNQNEYTYIDIDGSLKDISEKYLLPSKLGTNKKFIAEDARSFLYSSKNKYDLIILDVYTNVHNIPSYLITKDFFNQVNNNLADNGIMLFNVITTPNFNDRYSIKIDNTLRQVFPNINRQIVTTFDAWENKSENQIRNVIYAYFKRDYISDIYTDNKNTYFLDH